MSDEELESERKAFFEQLVEDITEDRKEVGGKLYDLWAQACPLNRFKFRLLDEHGGTKRMQYFMEERIDIFGAWGEEPRRKYGDIIPEDFQTDPFKTFEYLCLDIVGSTEWLESALRNGRDVLKEWSEEAVRKKYGHLIKHMPRLPSGVVEEEDEDQHVTLNALTDFPMEED